MPATLIGVSASPGIVVGKAHLLLWEVEVRHQGHYRRQAAAAAFSRAEWEIAYQEQLIATEVTRRIGRLLPP